MDEVLKVALIRVPDPIQWDETAKPVTPRSIRWSTRMAPA
jgi:hypothetical protein